MIDSKRPYITLAEKANRNNKDSYGAHNFFHNECCFSSNAIRIFRQDARKNIQTVVWSNVKTAKLCTCSMRKTELFNW